MNRRGFLSLLATCAGALALRADALSLASAPIPPRLVGDGVTDDTAALQAMIDACARSGDRFVLRDGHYRIASGPIIIPHDLEYEIVGNVFNA